MDDLDNEMNNRKAGMLHMHFSTGDEADTWKWAFFMAMSHEYGEELALKKIKEFMRYSRAGVWYE